MKATFDREGLLNALQLVGGVIPARTPRPVLQNIKLVATKDKTVAMATDSESGGVVLEVRGVHVQEPGEILLPKDQGIAVVREATDQELQLDGDADHTLIVGENSEFELPGEDPTVYPDVTRFEGETYHEIAAGSLREMIHRTIFAAATESHRYAMTGTMWELEDTRVRLVATDGKRLSMVDGVGTAHGEHGTGKQTPVVPTKVMQMLERNLVDPDEPVRVRIGANEALFKTSRAEIYGRLVEGRFPPYREVFPKKPAQKIPLPVAGLMTVTRQAAILTGEDSRGVDFDFTDGRLTLKARAADKGRAKVTLPVAYSGPELGVTFDPKLVLDLLRVLEPDHEIVLELVDEASAAVFRMSDKFAYLMMPLARPTT